MTRIAYLDCVSGISGDMLLGALIAAGLPAEALGAELAKLNVTGWQLRAETVTRGGIAATLAHVDLGEQPQPHRRLPDILSMIEGSSLPAEDRERAAGVFRRLADAEARVHGTQPDEIDFHEVGALDAIGLDELLVVGAQHLSQCGAVDFAQRVGEGVGRRLGAAERLLCLGQRRRQRAHQQQSTQQAGDEWPHALS